MTLSGILIFCAAYLIAVITPGPGVLALISRVLVKGTRGIPAFIAGFVAGDLIWFTIAATGLAVLAQTFEVLFLMIKYGGALFLLYLAYRFWTAPVTLAEGEQSTIKGDKPMQLFLGGLALTLGNPKVVIFFMALLPSVIDLGALTTTGFVQIALLCIVCLTFVLSAYVVAAAKVRRWFMRPQRMKLVNRGSSVVMATAAAAVASR